MKTLEINEGNINKSLGNIIRLARLKSKVSINEISSRTKINKSLLLHLENDRFDKLPNKVYVDGFLKLLSTYLNFDLKEAQEILAFETEKQNASNLSWEKVKIMSFKLPLFYKKSARFSNKIIFACMSGLVTSGIFAFMLFGYGVRKAEVSVKKDIGLKAQSTAVTITREKPTYMNPTSISIEALHGDSWIAYKINDDEVITLTLKKGKNLNLKANLIRLVLGNYTALKIIKNGEEFTYDGKLTKNVANIIFPERMKNEYEKPYINLSKESRASTYSGLKNSIEI